MARTKINVFLKGYGNTQHNARKLLTGPVKPEFNRLYILWSKYSHSDIGKSTTVERYKHQLRSIAVSRRIRVTA